MKCDERPFLKALQFAPEGEYAIENVSVPTGAEELSRREIREEPRVKLRRETLGSKPQMPPSRRAARTQY
jgi:hypothetical protein